MSVSVEGLGHSESLYKSVCDFFPGKRILTICDESSRIKTPDAKRTKRSIDLGYFSTYKMILNGTPIALGVHDLWSQFQFLDPNIIGTGDYWAFKTRYLVMGGFENRQIVGVQRMPELMQAINPYTIEVGKEVLDLPPKVMIERSFEITPEQRKLMRQVIRGASVDADAPVVKVENALEKVLRCRQIVNGWMPVAKGESETEMVPLDVNPKMDTLLDVIDENFAGTKFVIWANWRHEIAAIRDKLISIYGADAVECYYGETAMSDRSRIEDRYCNDKTMRFFVGNPASAGLGLTLISGETDVMIYYAGTNAYIERAQSEDRSHRLGQKRSVSIIDIIGEKTVDEVIAASIKNKASIEEFVLENIRAGKSLESMLLGE